MAIRYTYPDIFLLERRRPSYINPNYLHIYTLMNFYFPFSYIQEKSDFLKVNFYFITLTNFHFWIIIFVIIIVICLKISKDITKPLLKLKNAIDTMSFNDEKIFEYKDDDNINELFVMCKELVNIDKFKENMKGKYFFKEKKILDLYDNKNNLNGIETEDKNSLVGLGVNRNLIINNQLFEKNRKIFNQEIKNNFGQEIIVFKDLKSILKLRQNNSNRKSPKIISKIGKKIGEFNLNKTLKNMKSFNKIDDFNIKSKIRDNFLRDSLVSNTSSELNVQLLDDKENKNDNELNILFYALLFYLGKNLFYSDYNKHIIERTYINNDTNRYHKNSIKNYKTFSNKKIRNNFYNYEDSIYENNNNIDNIYEEKNSEIDSTNNKKELKENFQIFFDKNNLYYKYLNAKNNPKNIFISKYKKIHDLKLDINFIDEIEEDDKEYLFLKKTMKKKSNLINEFDTKPNLFENTSTNQDINNLNRLSHKIKGVLKNYNKSEEKKLGKAIRNSAVHIPNEILSIQSLSNKPKKLGMRTSVSSKIFIQKTFSKSLEKDKIKNKIEDEDES